MARNITILVCERQRPSRNKIIMAEAIAANWPGVLVGSRWVTGTLPTKTKAKSC